MRKRCHLPPPQNNMEEKADGLPLTEQQLHHKLRQFILEVATKHLNIDQEKLKPTLGKNGKMGKDPLSVTAPKSKKKGVREADLGLHCWAFSRLLGVKKPAEAAKTLADALSEKLKGSELEKVISKIFSDDMGQLLFSLSTTALATATMAQYFGATSKEPEPEKKTKVLIEFSSPNTNKPQHLGHVRNNVLGDAMARLLSNQPSNEVLKVNLINDRGVHICKSMYAYKMHGEGETPKSAEMKGDHLVGKYYVEFEEHFQKEYKAWLASDGGKVRFEEWCAGAGKTAIGRNKKANEKLEKAVERAQKAVEKAETTLAKAKAEKEEIAARLEAAPSDAELKKEAHNINLNIVKQESAIKQNRKTAESSQEKITSDWDLFKSEYKDTYFNNDSEIGGATREMLRKWEDEDKEVRELWAMMNSWVFDGFSKTYETFGIAFDIIQKESETYVLGKSLVMEGLEKGLLEKAPNLEDKAVYCDLKKAGVKGGGRNKKYLLRSDGTSIYMTQDLGTAAKRFEEYGAERLIYVVADEQITHFKELFGILYYLKPEHAGSCKHLSYGMVNLPHGRMKSREGTVVDADNLYDEIRQLAAEQGKKSWEKKHAKAKEAAEAAAKEAEKAPETQKAEAETKAANAKKYAEYLKTSIDLSDEAVQERSGKIALAAIKFYLLAVNPTRSVVFDPEESLSFEGKTGPYMLFTYARTRSILRKSGVELEDIKFDPSVLGKLSTPEERQVLTKLMELPESYVAAAEECDPSKVAEAVYFLAKAFSVVCQKKETHSIINCKDPETRDARLQLTYVVGCAVKEALTLLGIDTIEQM